MCIPERLGPVRQNSHKLPAKEMFNNIESISQEDKSWKLVEQLKFFDDSIENLSWTVTDVRMCESKIISLCQIASAGLARIAQWVSQNSGICCFSEISAYGGGKMLYMEASNYAEMFANAGQENVKFWGLLLPS